MSNENSNVSEFVGRMFWNKTLRHTMTMNNAQRHNYTLFGEDGGARQFEEVELETNLGMVFPEEQFRADVEKGIWKEIPSAKDLEVPKWSDEDILRLKERNEKYKASHGLT